MTHPGHSIETGVPVSEVVRQLDFAASENLRLRERLEYNNEVLDRKLQEIEALLRQKETENQREFACSHLLLITFVLGVSCLLLL